MAEIRIRSDEGRGDERLESGSVGWGLYSPCQASQLYYESREMKAEAGVFRAYLRRLEEKFGTQSDWRITR
jgi:hypothetical protein